MQKIVANLWFDGRVEEALEFYTSLLPDSRVLNTVHYGEVGPGAPDQIMFADFELAGQQFTIVNGNTFFKPNAAFSLCINCDDQAEIDRLWDSLTTNGGAESVGGWLTDRFGVSWQISAPQLHEMLASEDAAAVARVTAAFMKMKKLDIAELERAFTMAKPKPTRHAPQEVNEYLAQQAPQFREILEQLREIIVRVAPQATQRVSYKIPIFRLQKDFVAISAAKKHCGLHTMSKAVPLAMKDELKAAGIWISGTTLHIKSGQDLPIALIEKALRARLAELP